MRRPAGNTARSFLVLSVFLATGCGNGARRHADAGPPDASGDAEPPDAGDAGDGGDAGRPSPRPVAPHSDPVPIDVPQWMTGWVRDPAAGDPVMDAIDRGTFTMPAAGRDRWGIDWIPVAPGENGEIGNILPSGVLYGATTLAFDEPTHVIARADTVLTVHLGPARQPGDLYHYRNRRVPLRPVVGENLVVVRGLCARPRPPEIVLWTTPDELVFNLDDVTVPDLREGEATPQWIGVPILNMTGEAAIDATARVVENEHFEETTVGYPALAPGAVTQVAFRLVPKAPIEASAEPLPVTLRIESDSMWWSYEREVAVPVVARDAVFRRTFRSAIDGSAQYYAVQPPADFDPDASYGLVLTLHGAGVQANGQAAAYSKKDWAWIVAPTNRRPFGFDWEEWGRLDGIEVLDLAMEDFDVDPTRVYLTGHSMGGHGTWQLGVLFPGRFAVVAPSAGWASFYSYTGYPRPTGSLARARASSDTVVYIGNLAQRGIYIIHGSADDNVPVREGRTMFAEASAVSDDVVYHEEPGAGHWWDGDAAEGADCVDWPPLFDFMQAHTLDPFELEFDFLTPSPWVTARHSFVTIRSCEDAFEDCGVSSALGAEEGTVEMATTNVRSMTLDGAALRSLGIGTALVDGARHDVPAGTLPIGPQDGKRPDLQGPLNQAYQRPFCFAYADDGPDAYREFAAYLVSSWSLIGNGHGCALPASLVDGTLRQERNVVWLGVARASVPWDAGLDMSWTAGEVSVGGRQYANSALAFVQPDGDRLSAAYYATAGSEYLLFRLQPFSSRSGMPDYLVLGNAGLAATGFFEGDWQLSR